MNAKPSAPPAFSPPSATASQRGVALLTVLVFTMLTMLGALWASRTSLFNEMVVGNDADYQRAFEAAQALLQDAELDIRSAEPDGKTQITSDGVDCTPGGDVCRLGLSNYQIPNEQQDVGRLISELSSKTESQQCWLGLCAKRTGKQDFWNDETTLNAMTVDKKTGAANVGARYGRFTGAKQGSATENEMANPLLQWVDPPKDKENAHKEPGGWYWIEVLPYVKQAAAGGLIVDATADTDTGSADILRLSATPNVVYRITAVVHGRKPGTQVVLQETYVQQRRKD